MGTKEDQPRTVNPREALSNVASVVCRKTREVEDQTIEKGKEIRQAILDAIEPFKDDLPDSILIFEVKNFMGRVRPKWEMTERAQNGYEPVGEYIALEFFPKTGELCDVSREYGTIEPIKPEGYKHTLGYEKWVRYAQTIPSGEEIVIQIKRVMEALSRGLSVPSVEEAIRTNIHSLDSGRPSSPAVLREILHIPY
ncbi:MAG: hypothetical protein A2W22_06680 [Candidatus Levybacteria bacterium RBG_16_35_11]|nr:MAG: hypothetical protein A2W22_06680 [Candidatus Levybacteria bacterium RBG_16_35_11]